jgi:hypothetical protein
MLLQILLTECTICIQNIHPFISKHFPSNFQKILTLTNTIIFNCTHSIKIYFVFHLLTIHLKKKLSFSHAFNEFSDSFDSYMLYSSLIYTELAKSKMMIRKSNIFAICQLNKL